MKRLAMIIAILAGAVMVQAAGWYQFPEQDTLGDADRLMVFDNTSSATRNITGLKLKQDIAAFVNMSSSINLANTTEALELLNGPSDEPLVKQAGPSATTYTRVFEVKDKTGKIFMYMQNNGVTTYGTPKALAVSSVFPANGATAVATSSVPYVDFNKEFTPSISTVYIVGNATAPVGALTCISGCGDGETPVYAYRVSIPATLAAGTTYTIRVVKNNILQTDGETTSSCGTAMTDVAGVCQSTFTTAP